VNARQPQQAYLTLDQTQAEEEAGHPHAWGACGGWVAGRSQADKMVVSAVSSNDEAGRKGESIDADDFNATVV